MIKVGLCGSGFMAGMHSACYAAIPGVKIAAVASKDKSSADKLAGEHGAETYSDARDLIAKADVDVVDICLPTPIHAENVVLAAKRGVSIFCEKPLARTMSQANRMVTAVKTAKVNCMIGHCIRFWPEYMVLKDYFDKKKLGKLQSLSLRRVSARPTFGWRNWFNKPELSGGAFLDFHIHDVDYVRYLLGEPKGVDCVGFARRKQWDWCCTNYHFPGMAVSSEAGWSAADPFEMTFRAAFEKGTLLYSSRQEPLTLYMAGRKPRQLKVPTPKAGKAAAGGNISDLGGYFNELKYFVDCLKKNKTPDAVTIEDARDTLALVFQEMASAKRKERALRR